MNRRSFLLAPLALLPVKPAPRVVHYMLTVKAVYPRTAAAAIVANMPKGKP